LQQAEQAQALLAQAQVLALLAQAQAQAYMFLLCQPQVLPELAPQPHQ
jgi:hypothetical protein